MISNGGNPFSLGNAQVSSTGSVQKDLNADSWNHTSSVYVIVGSAYKAGQEYDNAAVQELAKKGSVYVLSIDIGELPTDDPILDPNIHLDRIKLQIDLADPSEADQHFFTEKFQAIQSKLSMQGLSLNNFFICNSVDENKSFPALGMIRRCAEKIFEQASNLKSQDRLVSKEFAYVTPLSTSSSMHELALETGIVKTVPENMLDEETLNKLSPAFSLWITKAIKSGTAPMKAKFLLQPGNNGGWCVTEGANIVKTKFCKTEIDKDFFDELVKNLKDSLVKSDIDKTLKREFLLQNY